MNALNTPVVANGAPAERSPAEMIPSPRIPAGPSDEDVDGAADLLLDGARFGDLEDVNNALELGTDPNMSINAALHMAAANGHLDIVQRLLGAGADLNSRNESGNTPLHWACLNGQAQVTEYLLRHGANISVLSEQGRTPVDEVLGKEFQDSMLAVIDSFQTPAPPGALDADNFDNPASTAPAEPALR